MNKDDRETCVEEMAGAAMDMYQLQLDLIEDDDVRGSSADWFCAIASLTDIMVRLISDDEIKPALDDDKYKRQAVDAYSKIASTFFKWKSELIEHPHHDKINEVAYLISRIWQTMPEYKKLLPMFPPDLWPYEEKDGDS